jgi:hypothetical protein
MGADTIIGADMARLSQVAKQEDIDIYTYKEFCNLFVNLQSKQEEKQRKDYELEQKAKKNQK